MVVESMPRRLWHSFLRWWTLRREETPEESRLSSENQRLRRTLADRDEEITGQKIRIGQLEAKVRVQQVEIDELAAVQARNQKRIEADTAAEASKIALATFRVTQMAQGVQ